MKNNNICFFGCKCTPSLDVTDNKEMCPTVNNEYLIPNDTMSKSEIECGISEREEKEFRYYIAKMIMECCLILKAKHSVILTSLKLMQYVYYKISYVKYDALYIGMICVFIGAKMEETPMNINDIINTFIYLYNVNKDSNEHTKVDYSESVDMKSIRNELYTLELIIIKELGYYLSPYQSHPHRYLLHFIKKVKNDIELFKKAWCYLNDMYLTSVICCFSNSTLVCAAIFLASRTMYISTPEHLQWWTIFNVTFDQIEDVAVEVLKLHSEYSNITHREIVNLIQRSLPSKEKKRERSRSRHHSRHHHHSRSRHRYEDGRRSHHRHHHYH